MRIKSFILFMFLAFFAFVSSADASKPRIVGEAGILIDGYTGEILYAKNIHRKMTPASTTKILTAIIAIEKAKLSDTVITSEKAAKTGEASIWLEKGEKLSLEEMLYGLMLNSGNDASVAIAEHVAGSVPKFARLMNKQARLFGANSSHFVNPNGLPASGHLTTAYDLAIIAKHAMRNHEFARIVATKTKVIPWAKHKYGRRLINHNKLLWRYQDTIGIKTGYTVEAGQCLVSAASRNGHMLISVVLKSKGRAIYSDTISLFEYGFRDFTYINYYKKGTKVKSLSIKNAKENLVPVIVAADVAATVRKGEAKFLTKSIKIYQKELEAPIKKGYKVGEIIISKKKKIVSRADLVAGMAVDKLSFWERIKRWFGIDI